MSEELLTGNQGSLCRTVYENKGLASDYDQELNWISGQKNEAEELQLGQLERRSS